MVLFGYGIFSIFSFWDFKRGKIESLVNRIDIGAIFIRIYRKDYIEIAPDDSSNKKLHLILYLLNMEKNL